MRRGHAVLGDGRRMAMRRGVVARRCSCGSFWQKGALACGRCGSGAFSSWGFYVDTHPRGVPRRAKTFRSGFRSKDEAERELLELLKGVHAGVRGAPSKQPLERYLGPWLETRTHLRPTTAETYGILIDRYVCSPDFGIGAVPLRDLTPSLICGFYADVERRGRIRGEGPLSPKAVHNVHLMLRKALEDAVEDGLIPANPARRAHKLPAIHREMKTWTDAQLASFLHWVRGSDLFSLWRTAATTGMRRGELLGATWPALDLETRRLHVTQALAKGPKGEPPRFGPPKTDRGRRAVPLDTETARILGEPGIGEGPPSRRQGRVPMG
jgi:integrase